MHVFWTVIRMSPFSISFMAAMPCGRRSLPLHACAPLQVSPLHVIKGVRLQHCTIQFAHFGFEAANPPSDSASPPPLSPPNSVSARVHLFFPCAPRIGRLRSWVGRRLATSVRQVTRDQPELAPTGSDTGTQRVPTELLVRQEQILLSGTWYGAESYRNSIPLPDTSGMSGWALRTGALVRCACARPRVTMQRRECRQDIRTAWPGSVVHGITNGHHDPPEMRRTTNCFAFGFHCPQFSPEPPFMLREGVSARDSVGKPAVNLRDSAGPCSRLQDWHCPLMQVPFGCAPQPEEANGLPFVQRSLAGALKLTLSVPPPLAQASDGVLCLDKAVLAQGGEGWGSGAKTRRNLPGINTEPGPTGACA